MTQILKQLIEQEALNYKGIDGLRHFLTTQFTDQGFCKNDNDGYCYQQSIKLGKQRRFCIEKCKIV
jgi:hypothetical protein